MDKKTKELIAVGAAVCINCQPCLEKLAGIAREGGADERDIMAAIAVGKMVRVGATGKMDDFISGMFKDFEQCAATVTSPCGCN
jgi:AhpD family alkylhydroperoxidase